MVNIFLKNNNNTPISCINGSIIPMTFTIDPDGFAGSVNVTVTLTPLNNDNVANFSKSFIVKSEGTTFEFTTEKMTTQIDTLYKLYIVVSINGASTTSPYYLINTNTGGTIIFKHNEQFNSPIRGFNLIIDHLIEGAPTVEIFASNIPVADISQIEWFDITNEVLVDGTSVLFNNMETLRDSQSDEFPLYFKINVTKSSNNDNYKFFGYVLSTITDSFYKEY